RLARGGSPVNVPYSSFLNQPKLSKPLFFGSIPPELEAALAGLPFEINSSGRNGRPSSMTRSPCGTIFSSLAACRFLKSGSCGQLGAGGRSVAIGAGKLRFGGTTSGERSL